MLTPAFTPEMVSMTGMGVGTLGAYLNNCVAPPAAPCGGNVTIGPLWAMLGGEGSMNVPANSTTMAGPSGSAYGMSPSSSPMAFTGAVAGRPERWSLAAGLVGVVAVLLV